MIRVILFACLLLAGCAEVREIAHLGMPVADRPE